MATVTYVMNERTSFASKASAEVHFKPMTNLELSNALAHGAKFFLSFIT